MRSSYQASKQSSIKLPQVSRASFDKLPLKQWKSWNVEYCSYRCYSWCERALKVISHKHAGTELISLLCNPPGMDITWWSSVNLLVLVLTLIYWSFTHCLSCPPTLISPFCLFHLFFLPCYQWSSGQQLAAITCWEPSATALSAHIPLVTPFGG